MLAAVAESQGGVFSRAQALDCGYTAQGIRDRISRGRWERVRYGQYAESLDETHLAPWDRELARYRRSVFAALNAMRPGSVAISHQSALVLHGLPVWGMDLSKVHLTHLDERRHGGGVAGVNYHRGRLASGDLTELDGRLVTAVPRAVVETACTASFEAGVVIADAALRDHATAEDGIRGLLRTIEFWPGSATARAALDFADGRSESVGESRMRVLIHDFGLPAPDLQVEYYDDDGFIGRVDFDFPGREAIAEFDGRIKYAGATADVFVAEKTRENRLRGIGLAVYRADWTDLDHPHRTANRLGRILTSTRRRA
ncbi:MAG TPA: type IV toxin-antitoxin system AbiEi family antitoxin domain-containing protein [Kribbella sp.]|nr:type IV toxin-antitoxin system AbiEi family antitoxin domain-containing protein [Kribbella sp.]